MLEGFVRSALASMDLTPEDAKAKIEAALNDFRVMCELAEDTNKRVRNIEAMIEGERENNGDT